jgi:putative DNA primase/helicase
MDNAIRIAGTLAVIDQGLATREVGAAHLKQGLTLVQWYLAEALRIRGAVAIPQAVSDAEALLTWLKKRGWKLFRSAHVLTGDPAQLRNKVRFMSAVDKLVANGYLVENAPGAVIDGVKTRFSWMVNPDVL